MIPNLFRRNLTLLLALLFAGVSLAQPFGGAGSPIAAGLNDICKNIRAIVPIIALLMFVTAGVVYAGGQILGAETRARANVWATAMLIGGIIGLIIAASSGYLLQIFSQAALGQSAISLDLTSPYLCA